MIKSWRELGEKIREAENALIEELKKYKDELPKEASDYIADWEEWEKRHPLEDLKKIDSEAARAILNLFVNEIGRMDEDLNKTVLGRVLKESNENKA